MFAGKEITMGDEKFIVPALSLGQLRNGLLEKLQKHDKMVADGEAFYSLFSIRGEIILAAIQRNYPEFSEEKLMSYLDMANITSLWMDVLGLSGFAPGEGQAVTQTTNGT